MRSFRTLCVYAGLTTAAVLLVTVTAAGQKKGGKQGDTPVTSTFGAGTIQSDGLGPYTSFTAGKGRSVDKVVSIIQTSNSCCNDWILDTLGSTTREVLFDFGNLVPGTPDLAPFLVDARPARMKSGGANAYGPPDFPDLGPGESMDRPLWIRIANDASTYYGLSFNADNNAGTTFARVTCDAVDPDGCSAWTVDNGTTPAIGRLFFVDGSNMTWLGDYYMTFSVDIAR